MLLLVSCVPSGPPPALQLRYPANELSAGLPDHRALARGLAAAYVWIEIHAPNIDGRQRDGAQWRSLVNAGSGTVIDTCGHVITAAHIAVAMGLEALVFSHDGQRHAARIIHVAPERELALLRVHGPSALRPPPLANTVDLTADTPVLSIGAVNNQPGRVTLGWLREQRPTITYADFQLHDALSLEMPVAPGHSGGPVVDATGRLLGIVAGFAYGADGYAVEPPLSYAVRTEAIREYLSEQLNTLAACPASPGESRS